MATSHDSHVVSCAWSSGALISAPSNSRMRALSASAELTHPLMTSGGSTSVVQISKYTFRISRDVPGIRPSKVLVH
jgi:hypothetical protein